MTGSASGVSGGGFSAPGGGAPVGTDGLADRDRSGMEAAPSPEAARAWVRRMLDGFGMIAATPELKASASNPMEACFYAQDDRVSKKWRHYLEIYDRHLGRFRDKATRLLEMGVEHGGSLQVWRRYLGKAAVIHGLDASPRTAQIDDPDLAVHVGNQVDTGLLSRIVEQMGGLDVVVDDCGHRCDHQITTFEHLFPLVADGGIYICEDTHSSYWRHYGGGLRAPGSFIEYAKGLMDAMHARYLEAPDTLETDPRLDGVHSVAVYDSMVVIEKRRPQTPVRVGVGRRRLE